MLQNNKKYVGQVHGPPQRETSCYDQQETKKHKGFAFENQHSPFFFYIFSCLMARTRAHRKRFKEYIFSSEERFVGGIKLLPNTKKVTR